MFLGMRGRCDAIANCGIVYRNYELRRRRVKFSIRENKMQLCYYLLVSSCSFVCYFHLHPFALRAFANILTLARSCATICLTLFLARFLYLARYLSIYLSVCCPFFLFGTQCFAIVLFCFYCMRARFVSFSSIDLFFLSSFFLSHNTRSLSL